jgi:hypothetical protein
MGDQNVVRSQPQLVHLETSDFLVYQPFRDCSLGFAESRSTVSVDFLAHCDSIGDLFAYLCSAELSLPLRGLSGRLDFLAALILSANPEQSFPNSYGQDPPAESSHIPELQPGP